MMILNQFGFRGSREPLSYARTFALEHLVAVDCVTADLRWALIELALRSFTALWASAQGRLVRRARGGKHRLTTADTMVAAGGR